MAPVRGRGGGARRGAGNRGRGRGGRQPRRADPNASRPSTEEAQLNIDCVSASADMSPLFTEPVSFDLHRQAQEANKLRYVATALALEQNKVEITQASKVRGLAAAWARHDRTLADLLLAAKSSAGENLYGVVEILKALQMLDAARRQRSQEKKLAQLRMTLMKAGKKGKGRIGRRMGVVKLNVHNVSKLKPSLGSASGALSRHIARWCRSLSAPQLEFFALHLPTATWRELADMCHLHPTRDFPALPWFLPYCCASDDAARLALVPDGSLLKRCVGLDERSVNEFVVTRHVEIPFTHLRRFAERLTPEAKARIAEYTPELNDVLWNYEDLACAETDRVVLARLDAGEPVTLPYGKLMERLLMLRKRRKDEQLAVLGEEEQVSLLLCGTLQERVAFWKNREKATRHKQRGARTAGFYEALLPHAERMLATVNVAVEAPVVVIGDASGSMEVAIETSTIIASFLRALTSAQLVFFGDRLVEPPFVPETIEQVLELAMEMQTYGSTCPAAALWPFYESRRVVKTFIITTDEGENEPFVPPNAAPGESYTFEALFRKYHDEVYAAQLVFVSFLPAQHAVGQMVGPLKEAGFRVSQFKLAHNRPDLTKLDKLVGHLGLEATADFAHSVDEIERRLYNEGLEAAVAKIGTTIVG